MTAVGTVNDEGQNVDLYIPRKCHASKRLIPAFDHGAIQIAIADVDENGVAITGQAKILCISGFLRSQGESDHAINHLCIGNGIIRGKTGRQNAWLKKRQADARKKFAAKARRGGKKGPGAKRGPGGKRPIGKGARPAGKGPRPEGKRPEGKRGPRPEGKRPEGKRGPRPEGNGPRPERPEGKRAPRPEGKGPRPERPEGKRAPRPAPKA